MIKGASPYFKFEFGSVPLLGESSNFLTIEGLARVRGAQLTNYIVRVGGRLIRSKIDNQCI